MNDPIIARVRLVDGAERHVFEDLDGRHRPIHPRSHAPRGQTGSQRYFATPPLEPGKTFTYEVEATWQDANGKQVRRTREVTVQANQPAMVNFTDNQSQGQNQNSDLNQTRNQDLKRDQNQKPIQNRDIPR
jgi:uncharacterized protein (TIGR03000 family)